MAISEQAIIDKLAAHMESISGVTRSYKFAENPDNLSPAQLPAVMFYPASFAHDPHAHFNRWKTTISIRAGLFVVQRGGRGGRLKFIENDAMPFGSLVRTKFEDESVLRDLLSLGTTGTTQAWLVSGRYGVGGNLLTHNGIEYIGWEFDFMFTNTS